MTNPICFICKSKDVVDLEIHHYSYYKCNNCEHTFSACTRKGAEKDLKKYTKRVMQHNEEFVQDALMNSFFDRINAFTKQKESIIPKLHGKRILDVKADIGYFVDILRKNGFKAFGLSAERILEPYWEGKEYMRIGDIYSTKKYEKYDTILLYDALEYSYCPYEVLLECFTRLNSGGKIIISSPINNDPRKNYLARTQEFSEKSISIFAKECCPISEIEIKDDRAIVSMCKLHS